MMDEKIPIYKDPEIAARLFEVYKRTGGSIPAVHRHTVDTGSPVSQPTLRKMEEWHGWKGLLKKKAETQMAVSGSTLEEIKGELLEWKAALWKKLKVAEDDEKLWQSLGKCVGLLIQIDKAMKAERPDPLDAGAKEQKKKGLTPETAAEFREMFLGIKKKN